MYEINRSIAVIRPRTPFIKWANSMSGDGREVTAEYFKHDCTVVLIPQYEAEREALEHVNRVWEEIFEEELRSWDTQEALWPEHRTRKMFWQWFAVEFHSLLIDPDGNPIKKDILL